MTAPTLRLAPADLAALAQEFETNLQHGRAFAKDTDGIEVLTDCILLLVHPDSERELKLPAQAVMITPAGIGIELRPFDETIRERIRSFVCASAEEAPSEAAGASDAADALATDAEAPAMPEPDGEDLAEDADAEGDAALDEAALDDRAGTDDEGNAEQPVNPDSRQSQRPRHEQLRNLTSTQQAKLARRGELNDRVILERLYGKNVWEPLLHNPRITVPEVARIARKGTAPRPLLELIVENNTWIQAPVVRRALLGNPRVNSEGIMKLLRITPKHELKVIVKTTAYSAQVRDAAKKLLS